MRLNIYKTRQSIAIALKLFLGAFFVFSALSKFVDIDMLNVYIFSFHVFSLTLSIVISWFLITAELIIGVLLLSHRYHSVTCLLTMLMTIGFTFFLAVIQLLGYTGSCHCFGEILPFTPIQSIVKNGCLILLILFVWRYGKSTWNPKWWLTTILFVVSVGIIVLSGFMGWRRMTFIDLQYMLTLSACMLAMLVLMTTRWYKIWWMHLVLLLTPLVSIFILSVGANFIHSAQDNMVNQEEFQVVLKSELADYDIEHGRHLVAFYSKSCNYCMMASRKVSAIQDRDNLPQDRFISVFPGEDTIGLSKFYHDGGTRYTEALVSNDAFVRVTYGMFPLVLLIEDGQIVETYSHGDISERRIKDFLL